jgi:copper chaperone CopZ
MKSPLIACTSTIILILTVHTCLAGDRPSAPKVANATNEFTITGMHCNGCAQGLGSELQRARGVASATVSFTNRLAVVAYNTNRTSTAKLITVIEEAGFKAKKAKR